ncbi:hypothetical protein SASPL_106018 [Salvia splendens]|uniref:WRKY domain-containing protein n=1 Tax=Salvia splendens TaxID=180675 RepID=A0A8X9A972_SALSN|nr:probable WRKY transcription factor 30 [Salvia splendens]KAG6434387.1 hypothetical protein SASPL_106018 [Salvia splendens]
MQVHHFSSLPQNNHYYQNSLEMESVESWRKESISSQLNHGIKLSNKLKKELLHHHSNSSDCELLIDKIISCYNNALELLNYTDSLHNGDSTTLLDFSPTSEVSDQQDLKDHVPKKRKSLERWSEEVHVCCGTRSEDQLEDGYNWRKYGQKDILGATHPRSYYRCTYRHTRGCSATKQVQRGEDDPSILRILYRGKHSCGLNQNKQNGVVCAETNEESKQLKPANVASPPLIMSEPTSMSTCQIDQSFRDSETFPVRDLDFFIDFDVPFFEVSSDCLSYVQLNNI